MSAAYAWRKPALLILMAVMLRGASTVVVQSNDPPGVGTNDTTPTSPVGGNSGATLGEQRLIALQWAANKWGATLDSFPRVTITVTWEALSCTDVKAALGAAGPQSAWHDFAGATVSNTWYAAALANALFGGDLDPNTTEISAVFNVNLGNTGCLSGVPFYLGLDNNAGNNVDLVSVALHEFAHGLGFLTLTDGATGRQRSDTAPHPSIWDNFLLDTTTGLLWKDMTNAQRAASAINTRRLVWNGTNVTNAVPQVLAPGTPVLKVTAPMSIAGTYSFGTAEFGPPLASPGVSAGLAQVVDTTGGANFGCNAFSPTNAAALSGKIALLDRGTCNFTVKVKNAQNAGALGVVIADNVAESLLNMSGFDPTIFIPSVIITQADGATLKSALAAGAVNATLGVDMNLRQGADPSGRALMYTPNPYQPGSSVSHWDLIAFPDQLMEPATSPDVSHEVTPPHDLTASLLTDIGWRLATIPATPATPQLTSPATGSENVPVTTSLQWKPADGALSYDVYLGAGPVPPLIASTTLTSYSPQGLLPNTIYHWNVVAKNVNGSIASDVWSFTTVSAGCSYALSAANLSVGGAGGNSFLNVIGTSGCPWTAVSNVDWITVAGGVGSGNGNVSFTVAANTTGAARTGTLTVAGKTFLVSQGVATGLQFIPITPCRVADTRNANGPFGGPTLAAQSSRDFAIPNSACNVPSSAAAYSVNLAVVPKGPLGYLTAYPTGQTAPFVANLNSIDGRVKSNAAIVPGGTGGAISIFASDATDVVIDINGYFVPPGDPNGLAFYPLTPCRIADTRNAAGPLGGPSFTAQSIRTFPIRAANCGIPPEARAYALNFAAVPNAPLGYMTAWPTGQTQPVVASLNAPTAITANAVIVGAGTNGNVDVFALNPTDLVIDVTGYFAPPGAGGLSLYPLPPCRVLDTRLPSGAPTFNGTRNVNVTVGPCPVPASSQAYVFSATVVPPGPLGFLTMWAQGQTQPLAAVLVAADGAVTSNLALIPTTNGSVSAFGANPTHLVLDIFGYFAP